MSILPPSLPPPLPSLTCKSVGSYALVQPAAWQCCQLPRGGFRRAASHPAAHPAAAATALLNSKAAWVSQRKRQGRPCLLLVLCIPRPLGLLLLLLTGPASCCSDAVGPQCTAAGPPAAAAAACCGVNAPRTGHPEAASLLHEGAALSRDPPAAAVARAASAAAHGSVWDTEVAAAVLHYGCRCRQQSGQPPLDTAACAAGTLALGIGTWLYSMCCCSASCCRCSASTSCAAGTGIDALPCSCALATNCCCCCCCCRLHGNRLGLHCCLPRRVPPALRTKGLLL